MKRESEGRQTLDMVTFSLTNLFHLDEQAQDLAILWDATEEKGPWEWSSVTTAVGFIVAIRDHLPQPELSLDNKGWMSMAWRETRKVFPDEPHVVLTAYAAATDDGHLVYSGEVGYTDRRKHSEDYIPFCHLTGRADPELVLPPLAGLYDLWGRL